MAVTSLVGGVALAEDAAFATRSVDVAARVPGIVMDVRYAGDHNFTGAPVPGYDAARCILTREAAAALAKVQADLVAHGLGLKLFDCYRPVRAVRSFVEWAKTPDERGKREFFPNVAKHDLFKLGYIADRSSHSRGSTVDLTLIDAGTRRELDMGTPFDFFDPRSHPDATGFSRNVAENRRRLRNAMRQGGFVPYEKEWWHFTLKGEPFPHRSFDVPIR